MAARRRRRWVPRIVGGLLEQGGRGDVRERAEAVFAAATTPAGARCWTVTGLLLSSAPGDAQGGCDGLSADLCFLPPI